MAQSDFQSFTREICSFITTQTALATHPLTYWQKKRLNKIKLVQQTDTLPTQKQMAGATSTHPQSHIFSSYYGSCSCSYGVIAVLPWALL